MADELFIDDGYTRESHLEAEAGLHPAVRVEYRPAVSRERLAYAAKLGTKDPEQVDRFECDLLARQRVALNGTPLTRELAAKLVPAVRAKVLDLVLGYAAALEAADQKN